MSDRLGENIQREWDEDPRAPELWDALQLFEGEPTGVLARLTELAEGGSALAMVFLGCAYRTGRRGIAREPALGEQWLARSARAGSIEGRFMLACAYDNDERFGEAEAEMAKLAERGYSPAMFYLGWSHYKGRWGAQDLPQALQWLTMAQRAGHLQAGHWLSCIYRKDRLGLGKAIAGWWIWLRLLRPWISYLRKHPTSDRLRLGANPHQMADRMKQRVEGRGAAS